MKHIKRKKSNAWTTKEVDYLVENYGRVTAAALAIELNRSVTSVDGQLYKMRKLGLIEGIVHKKKCQPVSPNQMLVNLDAVKTETLFLIGYGDYPMFYKRLVRDGLAKSVKEKSLKWFWDRREWVLSRWLDFFCAY